MKYLYLWDEYLCRLYYDIVIMQYFYGNVLRNIACDKELLCVRFNMIGQ